MTQGCYGSPPSGYLPSCLLGIHIGNIWKSFDKPSVGLLGQVRSQGHREFLLPSLQEVLIPEMKWRKVCPASRSLSLPDNIPCIPRASMDSTDSFFPSRTPPGSGELRVLVHDNCLQRPGFPCPHFCKKQTSEPKMLLRAVSYFIQIHKAKPSQEPKQLSESGGRRACSLPGLGSCLPPHEDA